MKSLRSQAGMSNWGMAEFHTWLLDKGAQFLRIV
jgi:hypothetical protein